MYRKRIKNNEDKVKYLKNINEDNIIKHDYHNGYKEIDAHDFEYYIWKVQTYSNSISRSIDFTKREINYIMKEFPNYTKSSYSEGNVFINKRYLYVSIPNDSLIISNNKEAIFYIVKLPDEWYYVFDSFNLQFFECDQIVELVDCLKNQLRIAKDEKLLENLHDSYYQEISNAEFNKFTKFDDYDNVWDMDFIESDWVDFTKTEVNSIKKLLPNNNITNDYIYRRHLGYPNGFKLFNTKGFIVSHPDPNFKPRIFDTEKLSSSWSDTEFYIIKLKDEWYYFYDYINDKQYKCDQFEGLINLIKDKYIKTINENQLYMKISGDDLSDKVNFDRQENFSKTEISYIKKYLNEKKKSIIFDIYNFDGTDFISLKSRNGNFKLAIYNLGDEWYLLVDHIKLQFYKCDQLDGLIECLEKIT